MINSLLGRKNKRFSSINKLNKCDGSTVTAPESIASSFNEYFTNIASSLKKNLDGEDSHTVNVDSYQKFLKGPVDRSMYI